MARDSPCPQHQAQGQAHGPCAVNAALSLRKRPDRHGTWGALGLTALTTVFSHHRVRQ